MNKQLPQYVVLVVMFAACFLALNFTYGYVIDLLSETNDCFFMFGRQFAAEFLDHPGAPLCYAGRFLGQFYHYRWLGALIVAASITAFGVLFHGVLAKLKGTVHVWEMLLPCALLLGLHTSTVYLVHDTLGLCVSCGVFLAYLNCGGRACRGVFAFVATPVVYLLLGFYVWFLVIWIIAFECLENSPRLGTRFKLIYAVFSMALPLVAWRWVFMIPLRSALLWPLLAVPPLRSGVVHWSFAQFLVDCLLAATLAALVLVIPFSDGASFEKRMAALWRAGSGRWSRVAVVAAITAFVLLLHFGRYDRPLATFLARHRLYKQRQWDALIEIGQKSPSGDLRVQFMTNFALCQKGRLLDEMFNYPQEWGTRGLVLNVSGKAGVEDDTDRAMYNSDLFYELGHVNAAFRHVNNHIEAFGKTYDALERMAQCSMVNGNRAMAAKHLNLLERTLFHRDFARRYKAIIADPEADRREFGPLRERLPVSPGEMAGHAVVPFLTLLEAKPDNRMAFDYLTAWWLLDKRKEAIATIHDNIAQFRVARYDSIPTHCQEALILKEREEQISVDLQGYRYDPSTVARVDRFVQDMSMYQVPPEHARQRYRDTYMFYYLFVVSPDQRRRMMEQQDGTAGPRPGMGQGPRARSARSE